MGYKTTGKPMGQDDLALVNPTYAKSTNRLDWTNRPMRHAVITANPSVAGTVSPRFKVIVNCSTDTEADIATAFTLGAVAGDWFYWDPKTGAWDSSLDEDNPGGSGVAKYANRFRTIDFLPVADSAGKNATAACVMEVHCIPSR